MRPQKSCRWIRRSPAFVMACSRSFWRNPWHRAGTPQVSSTAHGSGSGARPETTTTEPFAEDLYNLIEGRSRRHVPKKKAASLAAVRSPAISCRSPNAGAERTFSFHTTLMARRYSVLHRLMASTRPKPLWKADDQQARLAELTAHSDEPAKDNPLAPRCSLAGRDPRTSAGGAIRSRLVRIGGRAAAIADRASRDGASPSGASFFRPHSC